MLPYLIKMLRDPSDGSPSSVRHIGVLLVLSGIVHAFTFSDAAEITMQLLGSGLVCFGIRNKGTSNNENPS